MARSAKFGIKVDVDNRSANQQLNQTSSELDKVSRNSQSASKSFSSLGSATRALGAALSALAVGSAVKSLVDISRETSRLSAVFVNVTGSTQAANKEMAFGADIANRYGAEVSGLSSALAKFEAASKSSNLTLDQTRSVFESVVKASGALGLSADETQGALLALQQIMSKGTVQAEELRGQLGERLPGAFNLAAKAMGVTTQELGKMLEQGQVVSDEFLPKFARELDNAFGNARFDNLNANINRLSNAWRDFKIALSDTGFTDVLSDAISGITSALKDMTLLMRHQGPEAVGVFREALDALDETAIKVKLAVKELELSFLRIIEFDLSFDPASFISKKLAEALAKLGIEFGKTDLALDAVRGHIGLVSEEISDLQKKLFDLKQKDFALDLLDDMKELADEMIRAGKSADQIKKTLDAAFGARAKFPGLKDQIELYVDLQTEAGKAGKSVGGLGTATKGLTTSTRGLRKELDSLRIERYNEQIKLLARLYDEGRISVEQLVESVANLNKLLPKSSFRNIEESGQQAAESVSRSFDSAADEINRSLTDALLRGFESGKSFAENFRDTLKNLFKTLVLRPTIEAIVQPIGGGISRAIGLGGQTASNTNLLGDFIGQVTGGGQSAGGTTTGQRVAGVGASGIASSGSGISAGIGSALSAGIGFGASYVLDRFLASRIGSASATGLAAVGGIAAGGAAAGALGAAGVTGLGVAGAAGAASAGGLSAIGAGAAAALGSVPLIGWLALAALVAWKAGYFKEASLKTFGLQASKDLADSLRSSTLGKILAPDVALANSNSNFRFASPLFPIVSALKPLLDVLSSEKLPKFSLQTATKSETDKLIAAQKDPNFFINLEKQRVFLDAVNGNRERGVVGQSPFGITSLFFARANGRGIFTEKNIKKLQPVLDAIVTIDTELAKLVGPERTQKAKEALLGENGLFLLRSDIKRTLPIDEFVTQRLKPIFSAVGGQVNEFFKELSASAENVAETLTAALRSIALTRLDREDVGAPIINFLKSLSLSIDPEKFAQAASDIVAASDLLGDGLDEFIKLIDGDLDKLKRGVDGISKLKTAFSGLTLTVSELGKLALGITGTDGGLDQIQEFTKRFVSQEEIVKSMRDALFKSFSRALKPFFGDIDVAKILTGMTASEYRARVQDIINSGQFVGDELTSLVNVLVTFGNSAFDLGVFAQDASAQVKALAGSITQLNVDNLGRVIFGLKNLSSSLASDQIDIVNNALITLSTGQQKILAAELFFNNKLSEIFGTRVSLAEEFMRRNIKSLNDFKREAVKVLTDEIKLGRLSTSKIVQLADTLAAIAVQADQLGVFGGRIPEDVKSKIDSIGQVVLGLENLSKSITSSQVDTINNALITLSTGQQKILAAELFFNNKLSEIFNKPISLADEFSRRGIKTLDDFKREATKVLASEVGNLTTDKFVQLADTLAAIAVQAEQLGVFDQVPVFDQVSEAIQDTNDAIKEQIDLHRKLADQFEAAAKKLIDLRESLTISNLSPLSPREKVLEARRQFQSVSSQAQLGNLDAINSLPNIARNFLQISREVFASSSTFAADFSLVQDSLSKTADLSLRQAESNNLQAQQLSTQQDILSELRKQTDRLNELEKRQSELNRELRRIAA